MVCQFLAKILLNQYITNWNLIYSWLFLESRSQTIKKKMKKLIIILGLLSFSACSIFQTSENEKQAQSSSESTDEVYVFDEVSEEEVETDKTKELNNRLDAVKENSNQESDVFDETVNVENSQTTTESTKFYLQLGAFSTLKRAENFVNENDSQIDFPLSIMYNSKTSLYNVRSTPYSSKSEVQVIKDRFWKKNMFKDAFIVTE